MTTQLQRNFRRYLFLAFHCLLVPFLLASWPFLIHVQHSVLAPTSTVWTYVISMIWNSLLLSIPWPRDTALQTPAWLLSSGRSSFVPEDNTSQLPTTHFHGSLFYYSSPAFATIMMSVNSLSFLEITSDERETQLELWVHQLTFALTWPQWLPAYEDKMSILWPVHRQPMGWVKQHFNQCPVLSFVTQPQATPWPRVYSTAKRHIAVEGRLRMDKVSQILSSYSCCCWPP